MYKVTAGDETAKRAYHKMKIQIPLALSLVAASANPVTKLGEYESLSKAVLEKHFSFFSTRATARWAKRFSINLDRMARNWERGRRNPNNKCGALGTMDDEHVRRWKKLRSAMAGDDPCTVVGQLTQAIGDWAETHIGHCYGQKNHKYIYNSLGCQLKHFCFTLNC